ncbi:hypothetical protein B0H13DRAFT_1673037 [Mycena leptocephala]|nr:hypothetical protein B0H13DRAFT_1673037 [Mycena leptocephala]
MGRLVTSLPATAILSASTIRHSACTEELPWQTGDESSLWVEVGSQFVRRWRGFFSRLERLHHLDVDKPEHLWLLQTLFLDSINADCIEFQTNLNAHPMNGHETFNESPNDMRLLGQAQLGVYRDDCEGLHPDTIEKYYGVFGAERFGQSGAGHPPDEDVEHPSLAERIGVEHGPQVRHEAIDVPDHRNPFSNDSEAETKFFRVLTEVVKQKITPAGYGLLSEEWDEDGYPDVEILCAGKQMKTKIQVSLAHPIWAQRARFWVQGLNGLWHFNLS